ncbi:MAG: hypothetical protein IPP28_06760 [Xanthomonadales bacterium]|nr:hypothetical protein [Xanthomonadales bacterium]
MALLVAVLDGGANAGEQMAVVERLLDEVECAALHRRHGGGHIGGTGQEQRRRAALAIVQRRLQFCRPLICGILRSSTMQSTSSRRSSASSCWPESKGRRLCPGGR